MDYDADADAYGSWADAIAALRARRMTERILTPAQAKAAQHAAGPDLYYALNAFVEADERGQGLPFAEAMKLAVRALAKARGE